MPNLRILPYDRDTSWDNFCIILRSWKFQNASESDSVNWYKKSSYRIINNMVNNLRQLGSARTLLIK